MTTRIDCRLSPLPVGERSGPAKPEPGEGTFHCASVNSRSIMSRTPSRLSYTSVLVTRMTWRPQRSSFRVRSASYASSSGRACVTPSTSTISFPCRVTKSTMYRSMGCCRRNFQRARFLLRSACHNLLSALVCEDRSLRALRLNRSIPLTRPLRGRPLPHGERCTTRWAVA